MKLLFFQKPKGERNSKAVSHYSEWYLQLLKKRGGGGCIEAGLPTATTFKLERQCGQGDIHERGKPCLP